MITFIIMEVEHGFQNAAIKANHFGLYSPSLFFSGFVLINDYEVFRMKIIFSSKRGGNT